MFIEYATLKTKSTLMLDIFREDFHRDEVFRKLVWKFCVPFSKMSRNIPCYLFNFKNQNVTSEK